MVKAKQCEGPASVSRIAITRILLSRVDQIERYKSGGVFNVQHLYFQPGALGKVFPIHYLSLHASSSVVRIASFGIDWDQNSGSDHHRLFTISRNEMCTAAIGSYEPRSTVRGTAVVLLDETMYFACLQWGNVFRCLGISRGVG